MKCTFRVMSVLAVTLVIAALISSSATRTANAGDVEPVPQWFIPTTPPQNPVLIYDVSGSTLAGLIHFRLSVYDTGHASISAAGYDQLWWHESELLDGDCPTDGKAAFTWVGQNAAKQLQRDLKVAGAFRAANGMLAVDVPMTTVTVFDKASPDAKSHSFTFQFASSPEIEQTMAVVNAFIDEYFPGF